MEGGDDHNESELGSLNSLNFFPLLDLEMFTRVSFPASRNDPFSVMRERRTCWGVSFLEVVRADPSNKKSRVRNEMREDVIIMMNTLHLFPIIRGREFFSHLLYLRGKKSTKVDSPLSFFVQVRRMLEKCILTRFGNTFSFFHPFPPNFTFQSLPPSLCNMQQ